jgi:NAD+ kinase
MRTVGVVVNPIAGMGGRVGLKGTDGKVAEAREQGAEPRAGERAAEALRALDDAGDAAILTHGGEMGARACRAAGLDHETVGEPPSETSAADTREAVGQFAERGVDLVLFAGGDGTAVDVAEALAAAEATERVPMLGVPAGVKVYSEVFAVSPAAAGRIAAEFAETEPAEVNDLDEDAYRDGAVRTELRAVVRVPADEQRQASKQQAGGSVAGLAEAVADEARESDATYVLGPGSTVGAVKNALCVDGSPLGVDVYHDGGLVVRDGGESAILDALGEENVVVVSPIGGQGFIFGRGNQQLSPAVVRRCETAVVASRRKLDTVGVLRVDTGDPELDAALRGWRKVRVGRFERRLLKVV